MKVRRLQVQVLHSPTLNTVLMVESVLKGAKQELKLSELKRRLPRKVMHGTLLEILDYLQESGKILITPRGIVWTYATREEIAEFGKGGIEL